MKKLLLIPALATTVVSPIIASTSCSNGNDGWVKWDFAQNQEYDYKMDIPDETVNPYRGFCQYLDMIEKNPNDFAHEYLLSTSKNIESWKEPLEPGTEVDINITTWTDEYKINAFDKSKKRISFDVKINEDWKRTITDTTNGSNAADTQKIVMDLSCQNIPLTYFGEAGAWMITSGARQLLDDPVRQILINDKKWSISGSLSVLLKHENQANDIQMEFSDSNFLYNFHTALSDETWVEDENVKYCCLFAFRFIDHTSYFMSNIYAPH